MWVCSIDSNKKKIKYYEPQEFNFYFKNSSFAPDVIDLVETF